MPKPDAGTRELFAAVLPADGRVATRPMFGQMAAFVNGNMFAGIFGDNVFVRLNETERVQLLAEPGASIFKPM
jgi:TfoX/Sxy family transcriptional regulator of competence genes